MELRHLRYFKTLAQELSFTKAAARLHVTQSTLSHQIKQLEDEIGVDLLQRDGKKISLTHAGQTLLQTTLRTMEDLDQTLRDLKLQDKPMTGRLVIGVTHTFSMRLLGQYLAEFVSHFPLVKLDIKELPAIEIESKLLADELDVGVAYAPTSLPGLWVEPLFSEPLMLVTSKRHPFGNRKRLRMVELHNQKLALLSPNFATRVMLDACFKQAGIEPQVVAETNTIFPILQLVKSQYIATIISERAIADRSDLHTIILQDPSPTRTAALVWNKHRHYSEVALAFASLVKTRG
ncbi:MAG: LysR substrate-binding domain-containing protein [Burkholderiaceae bacterium]|nr:LysR substrate-binding domain-containing protein [Burkholderiaceae bacterium]MCD8518061.1 LysR substrate-binding domain-containing protein [Burkholderiaceae bacterium]